ncbi:Fe-S cluster assembly sulfur transfer protein SufU [Methanomethylophilus alvi]|uniref:Fe-S cluster assembly sulfur transfer protein SufU n=1 Tax=Methanomethylophilus alvi TaxID=1291540 RepID=UPI0037DC139A
MSSLTEHPEIMKQIVTDNYQYPRGVKTVDDPSFLTIHMDSASCIDDIYIQIRIENGKIAEAYWHGSGCAISMASTSIMIQIIKGKTVEEAEAVMAEFGRMLDGKPYDADLLGEAEAFANVNRQPARITCANIGWRGLDRIFKEAAKEDRE